ncbi:TPA: hypothetical protein DCZ15_03235 [Candidatus Falkowbacteria bacterium]|nr:MAG: Ribose-phosphate pyrophosphokinase [Candidatus Falkowbacteria bacterium GW2011_GWF2_43_32]HBA36863.1 hypothetical protein [Candidatus Falkowbacteria bacterium]
MEKNFNIMFYSGNGNHPLGARIIQHAKEYLGPHINFSHIDFDEFPDEESDARIPLGAEIKGKTIVFYQSIFNQSLFEEALELIWAIKKQYGAAYLIAIIPFLIFRRQDHEEKMEEICRLKMAIDRLKHAGVDELITVSPHSPQIGKLCADLKVILREVDPAPLFAATIKTYLPDNPLIYSPDRGSIPRALKLAALIGSQVIFSLKHRGFNNEVNIQTEEKTEISKIIAAHESEQSPKIHYADAEHVHGRSIVIVEDEVSTGTTANKTGRRLRALGAKKIIFLAVHPVLVRDWRRKLLDENPFDKIILGDTIPRNYGKMTGGKIHDISVAELVAQTLYQSLQPFL